MCARRTSLPSTTLTLQALIDFTLASFSDCTTPLTPAVTANVSHSLERFLRQQISYGELTQSVASVTGVIQPLEVLRVILETTPDPLPDPAAGSAAGQRRPSRMWSRYEDQRLLAGIYRNGIENWTAISKFVGNGRTRSQCSQRWYRGLNPKIRKDQWSADEEQRLMALVAEYGDKSWTNIAAHIGNRSDVQCRYRYNQLRKGRTPTEAGIAMQPFFRPPFPAIPPSPIRVPLLQEKGEECAVPVQFQIPVTAMALPFPVQLPFFQQPQQQQGDAPEGIEQTLRTSHRISAPTFDGRLYSVC